MTAGPWFRLRLLGGFALERDGAPRTLAYEKGRALLAYLAMEPARTHSRDALAGLLWPGLDAEAARTNLRQVLHDLRRALSAGSDRAGPLRTERTCVRFDASALDIDAAEFAAADPACPAVRDADACRACVARMEELAARYRGEFLAGHGLPECEEYEFWLLSQREALHLRALARFGHLADCLDALGEPARALPHALRGCEFEPWAEDGVRRAMRLYVRCGQRTAALDLFDKTRRGIERELGLAPEAETLALAQTIRDGGLAEAPSGAPLAAFSERRQITVLHCKLDCPGVDDPDEVLDLLGGPQARCAEILRAQGGHLAQVRGASLLAYFGYPRASEDAVRRALAAALALRDIRAPGVEVRVGVHNGLILSSGASGIPDATGSTTGMAIRLRQSAEAGEILISEPMRRLAAGYFEYAGLGLRWLPGAAREVAVFRLLGESGATGRLEAAVQLAPFVGRETELAALGEAWDAVRGGARRHLLLRGEAGIGKSRLLLTLKSRIGGRQQVAVRELRCDAAHQHSPFHPLVGVVAEVLAFAPDDGPEARFERLAAYVRTHYAAAESEAVPLIAGLLGLPLRPPYRESADAPRQRRERLLALLLDRVFSLAARQPVLLVVEDLHWADPSTLELLERFVADTRERPLLAVFTARPGFVPQWDGARVGTLDIAPLGAAHIARLVGGLAPALDATALQEIVTRADGVPLFAEELARAAAEARAERVPATLHDLLAARLDALGEAKALAQRAAAVGREFDLGVLYRSLSGTPAHAERQLARLEAAGLVERLSPGRAHFLHVLVRDAAYDSLPRVDRCAAHRAIADALGTDTSGEGAALLAHHRAAAGDPGAAVRAWLAAGQAAARQAASREALVHFRSGLALLGELPEGAARAGLELELQVGLGAAALAVDGYASAEGAAAFARAMTLSGGEAGGGASFAALWGLWASASSRVGYDGARDLADRLLELAARSGDPAHALQAHFAVGDTAYWRGEFAHALHALDEAERLWRPVLHGRQVAECGEDAGVTGAAYRSWVLWALGRARDARDASELSLVRARELGHPFSLAYALTFAALLACRQGEPARAGALAEETLALAGRHGYPLWQIGATLARGWAGAQQGDPEAVATIRRCVEATRAAMGGVTLVVLEPLAEACVLRGHHDEALAVIDEALALGAQLGDHHIDAVLWRLRGQALEGRGASPDEAADCYARALDIARAQGAEGLAARVPASLGT